MLEETTEYPENTFSSPFKVDPEAQEPQTDDDDDQSIAGAPSSPFQYDARDDTVDFQMLRQQRQASPLAPSEHSATPRKRTYEYGPDERDEHADTDFDGRYKKGANRRDESEINVHADEDASFLNEPKATDDAGQQEAGNNSMMEEKHNEGMSTVLHGDNNDKENDGAANDVFDDAMTDDDHDSIDDTHLSTFSAVPNADMTSFANLRRESPTKAMRNFTSNNPAPAVESATPSQARMSNRRSALIDLDTPASSPMSRRDPRGTPNLMDPMDQPALSPRPRYSMQNSRYSPERRSPLRTMRESMRSPGKASLLDFDLPPPPTPRSIPTVTPRELESLKSNFMSEVSSLKATLSGREAEVSSLKQAVTDAERRVGEAMEQVRNEAARKDELELEQAEWQRRGEEMETVLREVKADIVEGEHEKARLLKKVEEVEKGKEQLESRMVELESQLAAARKAAEESKSSTSPDARTDTTTASGHTKTAEETAREVQEAVEKVARELHTLYKSKHETKVAALKKSYESRWEKRVRETENKLKGVQEENQRIKEEREKAAASETANNRDEITHMMARANDEHEAEKRVLEAQIKGLQQEMAALREDRDRLQGELEVERAEKGELVAAVDEWLAIQQPGQQNSEPADTTERTPSPYDAASPEPTQRPSAEPVMEDFRRSVSHSHSTSASSSTSGLRAPSATGSSGGVEKEKKKAIPKIGAKTPRTNSGGKSGIAVFTPGRSGIMGSIERMGRGG